MALIIENSTKCPLCGEVLNDEKEFTGFPHFIANMKDVLAIFTDSGIHIECLNNHSLKNEALFYRDKFRATIPSPNSKCCIDNKLILKAEDIFSIPMLTSDVNEVLFRFNFLTFNKHNLSKWKDKLLFIKTAKQFIKDGKWLSLSDFNVLEYFIKQFELS